MLKCRKNINEYHSNHETPIKVLDKNKKGTTHRGFHWVYRSLQKRMVLFDYREGRGHEGPQECLKDFKGYLQTDGYAVYEDFGKKFDVQSNMIPQAPNNNQHTWANLEGYTRTLVAGGYETYVIMGSYGTGGTGSNGTLNTIDNGNITVPNRIWKVIVVIPQGSNDVGCVTTATRVIAVNTPNDNSVSSSWGQYRTSVDAIESATGYDLLSTLPDDIESVLESKVDTGATN